MKKIMLVTLLAATVFVITGCSSPQGDGSIDKVNYVDNMARETLDRLYSEKPGVEARIDEAPGYGVFSNIGTTIIFVGTNAGFGVVHDNRTGEDVYMNVAGLKAGIGLGVKDFRAVFIFNEEQTLDNFINNGWEWGAGARATAQSGEQGGSADVQGSFQAITVYQITESGIIADATLSGTKYWRNKELNAAAAQMRE